MTPALREQLTGCALLAVVGAAGVLIAALAVLWVMRVAEGMGQ